MPHKFNEDRNKQRNYRNEQRRAASALTTLLAFVSPERRFTIELIEKEIQKVRERAKE